MTTEDILAIGRGARAQANRRRMAQDPELAEMLRKQFQADIEHLERQVAEKDRRIAELERELSGRGKNSGRPRPPAAQPNRGMAARGTTR